MLGGEAGSTGAVDVCGVAVAAVAASGAVLGPRPPPLITRGASAVPSPELDEACRVAPFSMLVAPPMDLRPTAAPVLARGDPGADGVVLGALARGEVAGAGAAATEVREPVLLVDVRDTPEEEAPIGDAAPSCARALAVSGFTCALFTKVP